MTTTTLQDQIELEEMFNKQNISKVIIENLEESEVIIYKLCNVCETIKTWFAQNEFYASKQARWEFLFNGSEMTLYQIVQALMVSSLYSDKPTGIQAVIGRVAPQMGFEDYFDAIKCLAEICVFMAEEDLFDMWSAADSEDVGYMSIVPIYSIDEDSKQLFEFMAYMPPMVIHPNIVKRNYDYAAMTFKESMILQSKFNYHEKPIALDVINIANQVEWSIDCDVLVSIPEEDLIDNEASEETKKNYQIMCNASAQVYSMILHHNNRFFLKHAYDKRGRLYSKGYQIHLQACEYKRALMNFKQTEQITGVNW